ncbi:MAG TPA: sulfotransferase [Anaerolineales bacterium]|nr:sulfotransferase [Anaerolineales bacterium]
MSGVELTSLEQNATFICGHPKSGTSLLRGMLDSHPQLIVFPEETKFFRRVLPAAVTHAIDERPRVVGERILQVLAWREGSLSPGQAGFRDRDYSHIDHKSALEAYRRRSVAWQGEPSRLLVAAILAYGEATGRLAQAKRWVEKSPYNERYATRIFEWWPQARCLHVVRDPRDNYASYLRKHPDWTPETFAHSWRQSALLGWKNHRRFGAERYRIVRYEDLILRTEEAIAELVRFLEIEDSPALRTPTRAGLAWTGNSMFGEAFDGISHSPLGRHAKALPQADNLEIEKQLEPEMMRLGYSLTRPLTRTERLAGRVGRARWVWRRFRTAGRSRTASGGK